MKDTIKNALILFAITLVAGALLGIVYEVTKEPIRVQAQIAEQKANEAVFDGATFTDYADFDAEEAAALLADDSNFSRVSIDGVKVASINGATAGYVIQITSMGYGDSITWTLGLSNEGWVNGISLISINETPGLGMNAEKVIVPQLADIEIPDDNSFEVVKTNDGLTDTIDAISGATITSTAIKNGINAGLLYYDTFLKGES